MTGSAERPAGGTRHAPRGDPGELAALVDAARGGDEAAWEQLYRAYYPRLRGYASRRLDPEAAKDAVGETMVRAVASIGRFSWRGGGFEAWLFAILRHVVGDKLRRLGRDQRLPLHAAGEEQDLASGLLLDEEALALRRAFSRLSDSDQELLNLRCVAGLSVETVADLLGKRPGAVRMAQMRALDRLREKFAETSA